MSNPRKPQPLFAAGTVLNHSVFVNQSYTAPTYNSLEEFLNSEKKGKAVTQVVIDGKTVVDTQSCDDVSFSNDESGSLVVTTRKMR